MQRLVRTKVVKCVPGHRGLERNELADKFAKHCSSVLLWYPEPYLKSRTDLPSLEQLDMGKEKVKIETERL